jgi:hypothetical protein
LRDSDIRVRLADWILERHAAEPDTKILHELQIPRPSARVDLAVVNGRLTGFEIKSDCDSSARLGRQAMSFSQVFERMTLVTTSRHACSLPSKVPEWWEVVVFDRHKFHVRRRGRQNKNVDEVKLLHLLTKTELFEVEQLAGAGGGSKARLKEDVIGSIAGFASKSRIRATVRQVLKNRV